MAPLIICPECGKKIVEDKKKIIIEKHKLLIVEGVEDQKFFDALLAQIDIDDIQVLGVGGKTQIKANLGVLKDDPRFVQRVNSIGIVRDADDNARNAFKSIQNALKSAGLPCPRKPMDTANGPPKVNVMILPGGEQKGTLEDLCLRSAVDDQAIFCVEAYFDCLDARGVSTPARDLIKAKTNVFLSSRADPTLRLGEAARKGYWPFNSPIFDNVKSFLRSL